jgi:CBS domain containing-hemolysin-like protein
MLELILAVLALLFCSALSSGTEAALFAVPYGQVLSALQQKRVGASSLLKLKDDMARPIMAIVIINNIANILGSIAVGSMASEILSSKWIGLFSAVLTFLVIVYAEIIPKTVGQRYAESISLWVAAPVVWLTRLFIPVILMIEVLVRPFNRGEESAMTSEDEIRALTKLGGDEGVIEAEERDLIQRVFRLNDITARDIMTPSAHVDFLDGSITVGGLREVIRDLTHSRIPVYEGSIDQIAGTAHIRDLLQALAEGRDKTPIKDLVREATFISAQMAGDALIQHFQKTKRHLALVVNAQGTVLGVVSLEDVLEELVGNIVDETDIEPLPVIQLSEKIIVVNAATELREVDELLQTDLGEGRVGERLIEQLGRIPQVGEIVELGELRCVIVEATPRAIVRVRLELL